ncbi:HNH endonuclease family protein [Rhodococcus sp. NPDC054953]
MRPSLNARLSRTVRPMLRAALSFLVVVLVAVGYVLLDEWERNDSGSTPEVVAGDLADQLARLRVAAEASMDGYSRDRFPHWDTNRPEHGFGPEFAAYTRCTTRDVMMLRDASGSVRLDPKTCRLTVGRDGGWLDRYGVLDRDTGALREYRWTTDPSAVDAEHIVPLAEAWRSGARALDQVARRAIANDAQNLMASDPSANRSKGDQDAADYLPPGGFRCGYVDSYIRIKVKYGLTVDTAERAALRTAVGECGQRGEIA